MKWGQREAYVPLDREAPVPHERTGKAGSADSEAQAGAFCDCLSMQEMRRVFKERGLPVELTVIPFIESAFNLKAYSRAGAAGIWQFIKNPKGS